MKRKIEGGVDMKQEKKNTRSRKLQIPRLLGTAKNILLLQIWKNRDFNCNFVS